MKVEEKYLLNLAPLMNWPEIMTAKHFEQE
jgi:hypothetical protein